MDQLEQVKSKLAVANRATDEARAEKAKVEKPDIAEKSVMVEEPIRAEELNVVVFEDLDVVEE
ncbi:unnamed protein product [Ilex paraguariensis]|uniref:Uncharacterized protein n=1 Tax=Ilex paraguariensis TaxID=185542 RepID=A0ABC8R893_9AQUA